MRLLLTLLCLTVAVVRSAPVTIGWTEGPSMLRAQDGGAAGFFGGELVIAGGTVWDGDTKLWLKDVQIYRPPQKKWRSGPPLPVSLSYGPFVHSEDGLEIFGGSDGKKVYRESWKLDKTKSKWRSTGTLPADFLLGRAARAGGSVYLFGGCPDVADLTKCSDAVWRRDGVGPWRRVSTLPGGPLALPAIAVARGLIYLFGGCSMPAGGALVNRAEAYSYDPRKNTWATLTSLPKANRGPSAVSVDGLIYLFGGYTASTEEAAGKDPAFGFSADVLVYGIESKVYGPSTPMPFPILGIEMMRNQRYLYGAGGEDRMRGRSARLVEGHVMETAK